MNTLGGATLAERNVISGNRGDGITITGESGLNVVEGNYIGTTSDGAHMLDNAGDGIRIDGIGTQRNIVGVGDTDDVSPLGRNVIAGNSGYGVHLTHDTVFCVVGGNYIGVGADGASPLPNRGGILIDGAANRNTIGVKERDQGIIGQRNVISGNTDFGLRISGSGTTHNVIAGNFIGVAADGQTSAPNGEGVFIENGANHNRVGTNGNGNADVNERNTISSNRGNGVHISGEQSDYNIVAGNFIGTTTDGDTPLGNGKSGVRIAGNSSFNQIGSDRTDNPPDALGNVIAFNGHFYDGRKTPYAGHGVEVQSGTSNSIRRNSIYGNVGRAIDLNDDGPTLNDIGEAESNKANRLQDYPVVTKVEFDGPVMYITWTLNSMPNSEFIIDIYRSNHDHISGAGEAKTFVHTVVLSTNSSGMCAVRVRLPNALDWDYSATATDSSGNTSEVSFVDTDGDALADRWETRGLDLNEDGVIDLILPGANPFHKDIFVEIDSMRDQGVDLTELLPVVNAFEAAPIADLDPDHELGISLHLIDGGDSTISRREYGQFADGFYVDMANHLGTPRERAQGAQWAQIALARSLTFHYVIFAQSLEHRSIPGTAEVLGNAFIMLLGVAAKSQVNVFAAALEARRTAVIDGIFMHELGHNLGLRHGGQDDVQNKPNYLSVMNYLWSYPVSPLSIFHSDDYVASWKLDYSREAVDLDENAVDEIRGLGVAARTFVVQEQANATGNPINYKTNGPWNYNGKDGFDTEPVRVDFNGGGFDVLRGYEDWHALKYYSYESTERGQAGKPDV